MNSELIELSRSQDSETIEEVKSVLDEAKIQYSTGYNSKNFDITIIQGGESPEIILKVRRSEFDKARIALEQEYLKVDLPSDHYLLTFTNEELAEVLGKPSEWSPFDVAHARSLAEKKGVQSVDIVAKSGERLEKLKEGKRASTTLLFFGWLFAIAGGLIGVLIAWSVCTMKEQTPEGEFFTYDEDSRKIARPMLRAGLVVLTVGIVFRILMLLSD